MAWQCALPACTTLVWGSGTHCCRRQRRPPLSALALPNQSSPKSPYTRQLVLQRQRHEVALSLTQQLGPFVQLPKPLFFLRRFVFSLGTERRREKAAHFSPPDPADAVTICPSLHNVVLAPGQPKSTQRRLWRWGWGARVARAREGPSQPTTRSTRWPAVSAVSRVERAQRKDGQGGGRGLFNTSCATPRAPLNTALPNPCAPTGVSHPPLPLAQNHWSLEHQRFVWR